MATETDYETTGRSALRAQFEDASRHYDTADPRYQLLAFAYNHRDAVLDGGDACPTDWEGKAIRYTLNGMPGWLLTESIEGYCSAGQFWADGEDASFYGPSAF